MTRKTSAIDFVARLFRSGRWLSRYPGLSPTTPIRHEMRLQLEPMEPRVLLSGDGVAAAIEALQAEDVPAVVYELEDAAAEQPGSTVAPTDSPDRVDQLVDSEGQPGLDYLDVLRIAGDTTFEDPDTQQDIPLVGISGIAFSEQIDADTGRYFLVDDMDLGRLYIFDITLTGTGPDDLDLQASFVNTFQVTDGGQPLPAVDLESIAALPDSAEARLGSEQELFLISSEGDEDPLVQPRVMLINDQGEVQRDLLIPEKFAITQDGSSGVPITDFDAIESATVSPDGRFITILAEAPLEQDDEQATGTDVAETASPLLRGVIYDLENDPDPQQPLPPSREFIYEQSPMILPSDTLSEFGARFSNAADMVAVDNFGSLLVLESRQTTSGNAEFGRQPRLVLTHSDDSIDPSPIFSLAPEDDPQGAKEPRPIESIAPRAQVIELRQILSNQAQDDFPDDQLVETPEGFTFGHNVPALNGQRLLLTVSDNGNGSQPTEFIAFATSFETTPALTPSVETPTTVQDPQAAEPEQTLGEANDPGVWVHPENPEQSLIFGTLQEGGVASYDPDGNVVEVFNPGGFGEVNFQRADIFYGFDFNGVATDLLLVSDVVNDTLAILAIDPSDGSLSDVTGDIAPLTDPDALATYDSWLTINDYVYVGEAGGNAITQLRLVVDPQTGLVNAVEDESFNFGEVGTVVNDLAVDPEFGRLFAAAGGTTAGLLNVSAEPLLRPAELVLNESLLVEPAGGQRVPAIPTDVSIYADGNRGFIALSAGGESPAGVTWDPDDDLEAPDDTSLIAILERSDSFGSIDDLANFVLTGDGNGLDATSLPQGLAATNINLGGVFGQGMLVVQDRLDAPHQTAVVGSGDGEILNLTSNFKFLPLTEFQNVPGLEELPLDPTGFDPRSPVFRVAGPDLALQVLHANNLEGDVDSLGDAPNFAAIVDALEDEAANNLTLSVGDDFVPGLNFDAGGDPAIQEVLQGVYEDLLGLPGGSLADLEVGVGRVDLTVMNIVGFDASVLGDQAFEVGLEELASMLTPVAGEGFDSWGGAFFPYLAANLDFTDAPDLANIATNDVPLEDTVVPPPDDVARLAPAGVVDFEQDELGRVGIVGVTTPLLESLVNTGGVDVTGPTTEDMAELAAFLQPIIDQLRGPESINKIVLSSHIGDIALEQELLGLLEGVDILVAGADDADLAQYPLETQGADGVPAVIVSTAGQYEFVGRLNVLFDVKGEIQTDQIDSADNGPIATNNPQAVYDDLGNPSDPFAQNSKGELVQRLVGQTEVVAEDRLTLDIDGNGEVDGLTDGLMWARGLMGFSGDALVEGLIGPGATRTDPDVILNHINDSVGITDVDGNGEIDGMTDGLLIARFTLGFRGDSLVRGDVIGDGATRTTAAQIVEFLSQFDAPVAPPQVPAPGGGIADVVAEPAVDQLATAWAQGQASLQPVDEGDDSDDNASALDGLTG